MKKLFLTLFLPLSLFAIDLEPWYTPSFEFQSELTWFYQSYDKVEVWDSSIPYKSNDNFAKARLGMSILDTYDIQVEVVGGETRAHSFNFDHVSLTLRYLLMDDVEGDLFSLVVGATGIHANKQAVDDVSSFHHGQSEGELHVSIGKEIPRWDTWSSHWWLVGAVGCADQGSPWVRGNAYAEYQLPTRNLFIRFFGESLWGLGGKNITNITHFKGYGDIKHQSVDAGFRVTYRTDYCGSFYLQYARRFLARNYPKNTNLLTISYVYPFGL